MLSDIEKHNLSRVLERYSFEHLRPAPQVYEIVIPQDEYFVQTSSKDRRRKIFYKVKYNYEELSAIEQVKQALEQADIHEKLGDELILKHIYGGKWDIGKAVDRLKQVVQFHKNDEITRFDQNTIRQLQNGSIYCYGHDRGLRPIVIMRVDKIDLSKTIQQNFNIVYYLMLVVIGFKMVPYHAQKYTLIVDFNDISLTDIPYLYLFDVISKVNVYYCGNTERTLLYNSSGIGHLWKIFSNFLSENQKRKIKFVQKGEEKDVLQYITEFQLQKKYGGKLPNLTEYWPPKTTSEQFQLGMSDQSQDLFYSVQNDAQFFTIDQPPKGCGDTYCCSCNIY